MAVSSEEIMRLMEQQKGSKPAPEAPKMEEGAEEDIFAHVAASAGLPWHIKPRLRHPLKHFALD